MARGLQPDQTHNKALLHQSYEEIRLRRESYGRLPAANSSQGAGEAQSRLTRVILSHVTHCQAGWAVPG